jgi:hypothetical protein
MDSKIIRTNKVSFSILLFLVGMAIIHILQPSIIYNEDGGFRQFGLGYKEKTVLPIWFFTIILAILSYLFVLYLST